jgi:hypothetical protein
MPRCPVCKTPLTQRAYERALGILGARERHMHEQAARLQGKVRQAQQDARAARAAGIADERARTQRLLQGKEDQIRKLNERFRQLKKGSTPQTEGLEFEETLVARLHREFPDDRVRHEGKGGDVLQEVRFGGRPVGLIVYECKQTTAIPDAHIQQAARAKDARRGDFAVLVTTGKKPGFTGLKEMSGVLVVSPLGVLALASLLREQLKTLHRARLSQTERQRAAQKLLAFVTSPDFRNPIESVVRTTEDLGKMVLDEAKQHNKTWRARWDKYQRINWDTRFIHKNVQLVLQGKNPEPRSVPRVPVLALPPSKT